MDVDELIRRITVDLRRPLTTAEAAAVAQWAEDAQTRIRLRFGLTDLSSLDQAAVEYVIRMAVVDLLRRPDNAMEVSVRVDDGATTRRYESGTGQVHIRDEWWALLTPASTSSGAWSIRPSYVPDVPRGYEYEKRGW